MRSESWKGNCRKDAWESYIQLSGGGIWVWCSCLNPGNPRSLGGRGGFLETSSGRPPGGTPCPHGPAIQCLVLGVNSAVDEHETWRGHERTDIVRFYFWHERTDAVLTWFHFCGISRTGYFIETESRLEVTRAWVQGSWGVFALWGQSFCLGVMTKEETDAGDVAHHCVCN